MAECYARILGDCEGQIEDEHFLPQAMQRMFGPVAIEGMAWQNGGRTGNLPPGTYAHSRILCRKHHDALDGLDANAAAYFRNLMLMAGGHHLATGAAGSVADVTAVIDGRKLERWFLKLMCGTVVSGSVAQTQTIPTEWVTALFERTPWPEAWAMYFATGTWRVEKSDTSLHLALHWREGNHLNGMLMRFITLLTMFAIEPPDRADGLLRRPKLLGAEVHRDHGGPALDGLPLGEHIRFELTWPD